MRIERVMQVTTPTWCALALWRRSFRDTGPHGQWECTRASPPLAWMVGLPLLKALETLTECGWHWTFAGTVGIDSPLLIAAH